MDSLTKKTVNTFEGNKFNIYDPIIWDGRNDKGQYINTDRKYGYLLIAQGKDVIELEIGDSPFPTTKHAAQAGIEAIQNGIREYPGKNL